MGVSALGLARATHGLPYLSVLIRSTVVLLTCEALKPSFYSTAAPF